MSEPGTDRVSDPTNRRMTMPTSEEIEAGAIELAELEGIAKWTWHALDEQVRHAYRLKVAAVLGAVARANS